mmetsp:Transcript_10376/g.39257  ORF Transcript_10376/g.39257 Transcript_10376/m.39257 type:complete len:165 (-) Transcript_10376:1341-1835(-)
MLLELLLVAISLVLAVPVLASCNRYLRRRRGVLEVAFFHPYASGGGGGERVLWVAIRQVAFQRSPREWREHPPHGGKSKPVQSSSRGGTSRVGRREADTGHGVPGRSAGDESVAAEACEGAIWRGNPPGPAQCGRCAATAPRGSRPIPVPHDGLSSARLYDSRP